MTLASIFTLFPFQLARAADLNPVGSLNTNTNSLSLLQKVIGTGLDVLFTVVTIAAVVYVLWAGVQFITSSGDPEKAKKARAALINAVIGIAIIVSAYAIINFVRAAVGAIQDPSSLVTSVGATAIDTLLAISTVIAIIYIVWSGVQFITSSGDPEKAKKARAALINAVIGIAIIVSAYAIITFARHLGNATAGSLSCKGENCATTNTYTGGTSTQNNSSANTSNSTNNGIPNLNGGDTCPDGSTIINGGVC